MKFIYFIDRKAKFFLDFVKMSGNFVRIPRKLKKCEKLENTWEFKNFSDFEVVQVDRLFFSLGDSLWEILCGCITPER